MVESIIQGFDIWINAQGLKSQGRLKTINNISLEGIEKLKHLILGLSLSGKFSDASIKLPDNIEQVIKDSQKSYYRSIGRKTKDFSFGPPFLQEFSLPDGWRWKRIGELCDLQTGATPSTLKPEYYGGVIKWLVSGDINKRVIHDCEGHITREGIKNSNCKILPKDTVLIALNGQGKTRASVALLKVEAACNQSLVGIIPFNSNILVSEFLLLSLHYRYYEIRDITGQKQRRGLNMGLVSELSIPLPPLAEQRRILAKVDELMALCDRLEDLQANNLKTHQLLVKTILETLTQAAEASELQAAWERMSACFDTLFCTENSIDQLKQTILQLAVMGKLVPQSLADEPASILLGKISQEKQRLIKEGKLTKQKAQPKLLDEEIPYDLPKGWEWAWFSDMYFSQEGPGIRNWQFRSEGIKLLNVQNIVNGKLILDNTDKHIDPIEYEKKYIHFTIEENDLLFASSGGSWGKTALFNDPGYKVIVNTSTIRMHPYLNEYSRHYMRYFVDSKLFKDQMVEQLVGMQPNFGSSHLSKVIIPVPPSDEQHRIIAKVDKLFTICDALKANIVMAEEIKVQLAEAVVESAIA